MIADARAARALAAGSSLGRMEHAPVSRVEIAWYMVASYDRNPIHVDEPFAKSAGLPSVVGQGMIPLGYLASRLVAAVGHRRLRGLGGDFIGSVLPDEALVTEILLEDASEREGGVELRWKLAAENAAGAVRLRGWARTFHEDSDAVRG
ncbi:MAG: dehydratase [Alphaproteobacteria bacterium]|nr:dehydratase [Alphaproteobacteria bacterium]